MASTFQTMSVRALFLTDAECQGKCRPDDTSHSICLPDKECQGIPLRDTARRLQMQNVKANVLPMMHATASAFRTMRATVSAFRMRSVRALFLPEVARVLRMQSVTAIFFQTERVKANV